MISEEELRISNKSYINKDFATIYPEIIENFQKLTNRYDPETSNESDPIIVLLKLLAFIGDKNNYNIDKNALEAFMLSATQETSMRKLCDRLGYYMNYYIAPEVKVTVMYQDKMESGNIVLNPLVTKFGSKDETIDTEFILKQRITLQKQNEAVEQIALQGQLKALLVNTSGTVTSSTTETSLIQLDNLDDNNRLYFPESNVAQNGVFIESDGVQYEYWTMSKNLNYEKPLTTCFKFGYDSIRGLPYVEFPKDIADIIGNGVRVHYVVTDGLMGNIKAAILTTLLSSDFDFESVGYSKDSLYVRNNSASINGANPESIDGAYNGFKKTIGTFNTLVTCRDYANAFYNITDDNDSPYVSNIQVSDRRDDFNYTTKVVSYDDFGECTINVTSSSDLNSFQLCCYPLMPLDDYSIESYDKSFKPMDLTQSMKNAIDGYKTISHDYKNILAADLHAIINKLVLNAKLATKYKVSDAERLDIIENVVRELVKNFNARRVDYGVEIPYDSLVSTIENADERINYVILAEPEITSYALQHGGTEIELTSNAASTIRTNYVAKNVLNGNVSLFKYDDEFDYDFGQHARGLLPQIKQIDTNLEVSIGTSEPSNTRDLKNNQVIQIFAPNFITEQSYPAYCYFRFESSLHGLGNSIPAKTNYELQAGERLIMVYSQDGVDTPKEYVEGDIIQPVGFDLVATPNDNDHYAQYERTTYKKTVSDVGTTWFFSLGAQESINYRKINRTTLKEQTLCYWLVSSSNNTINWTSLGGDTYEYLLRAGEYFFYTDPSKTQLVSLGSGTTLRLVDSNYNADDWAAKIVNLDSVVDKGMLALNDYWKEKKFTNSITLTFEENQIFTLTGGDSLTIENLANTFAFDSTVPVQIPSGAKVSFVIGGESDSLPLNEATGTEWKIISRLDINVSKDEPQSISYNEGERVQITLNGVVNPVDCVTQIDEVVYLNLNGAIQHTGNTIVFDPVKQKDGTNKYPITGYLYEQDSNTLSRSFSGYSVCNVAEITESPNNVFKVPAVHVNGTITSTNFEKLYLMIYFKKEETGTLTLKTADDTTTSVFNICHYNTGETPSNSLTISEGINVIEFSFNSSWSGSYGSATHASEVTFTASSGLGGTVTIGTLDAITGYNPELGLTDGEIEAASTGLLAVLDTLGDDKFYYNNKIKNTSAIELGNLLNPLAFYDANNVYNKFTISKIDFSETGGTSIDVLKSSRL